MLTAAWLVWATLAGTLVAVACLGANGVARALRLPTRWVWAAGFAAMLLLGARSITALRAEIGVAAPSASARSAGASIASDPHASLGSQLAASVDATRHALAIAMGRVVRALPLSLRRGAPAIWPLASLLVLLVLAGVHLRIARLRRAWPRARLFGLDVRIAPTVGPAVLGVLEPFIVVPRWLLARSEEEQRLVLEHEREHLAARDHLLLAAATFVVAMVPWHPAVWWMLARLRLALELDCDARVLRRGIAPKAYGTLLIDLAGQCSSFTAGATALADESSHLHRRLLAMTPIPTRFTRVRATALATLAGAAILAACEAKVPTSADVENMDVASAERGASSIGLIAGDANTTYFVDGVKTDAATAHALPRTRIATIDVHKLDGASEIRIATLPHGAAASPGAGVHVTIVDQDSSHRKDSVMLSHGAATAGHAAHMDKLTFTGVIYIDGVRADNAALQALDPKSIISMEVMKGARAAQESSDPAAINGVIRVTTKAAATSR